MKNAQGWDIPLSGVQCFGIGTGIGGFVAGIVYFFTRKKTP